MKRKKIKKQEKKLQKIGKYIKKENRKNLFAENFIKEMLIILIILNNSYMIKQKRTYQMPFQLQNEEINYFII